MSEQLENTTADDEVEDEFEGDLGDGAKGKGSSAGIIGINPT